MEKNTKFKYIKIKGETNDKSKKSIINVIVKNYKFNFRDLIIAFLLITIIIFLVLHHYSLFSLLVKKKKKMIINYLYQLHYTQ